MRDARHASENGKEVRGSRSPDFSRAHRGRAGSYAKSSRAETDKQTGGTETDGRTRQEERERERLFDEFPAGDVKYCKNTRQTREERRRRRNQASAISSPEEEEGEHRGLAHTANKCRYSAPATPRRVGKNEDKMHTEESEAWNKMKVTVGHILSLYVLPFQYS